MGNGSQLLAGEVAYLAVTGTVKYHLCKWGLPQRADWSRRGCQWVSDGWICSGGRHLNASSSDTLLLSAITYDYSSLGETRALAHFRAKHTRLLHTLRIVCGQRSSNNNIIMFIQQTDDDYTPFHSPLWQKIDKSDWSSSAVAHLFIQTVYCFHQGAIRLRGDAQRIISLSLRQIITYISVFFKEDLVAYKAASWARTRM